MPVFTIHLRRGGLDPDRDIVVVKDGFCWLALIFGSFWALWHRLWWVAAGLAVVLVAVNALSLLLLSNLSVRGVPVDFVPATALSVLFGFLAHDLRVWTLHRQGFVQKGVVMAASADLALKICLDDDAALADDLYQADRPLAAIAASPHRYRNQESP